MKLELRDVLMRGKWYKEEDSEYEAEYWLEKSSLQLFYTENLICIRLCELALEADPKLEIYITNSNAVRFI